jgi:hypothetical protein
MTLHIVGLVAELFLAGFARAEEPVDYRVGCYRSLYSVEMYVQCRTSHEPHLATKEQVEVWEADFAALGAERKAAAAKQEAEEIALEQKQARGAAAIKKSCGKYLGVVSVGMSFDLVRKCAGPFELMGQVNRKDGVASVYRAQGGWVHVMGGKVVSWVRSP